MSNLQKGILEQRIAQFKEEIGSRPLNEEQKKIFAAFTKVNGSKIYVHAVDCEGVVLKVLLESSGEVKKILLKHYKGTEGTVSANDILNMFHVVRTGDKQFSSGNYVYTKFIYRKGKRYRVVLKIHDNGTDAVLKSFNTKDESENKKAPSNPPSANPKKGRVRNSKVHGKGIKKNRKSK